MAYTQIKLVDLVGEVSSFLDDPAQVYWTPQEITYAIYEGLRIWGAYAEYWRERGAFNLDPAASTPYYNLSTTLPALRSRSWTLDQMVSEIQFALLEPASGLAETGMSGQIDLDSITTAIQIALNKFIMESHIPLSVHSNFTSPPPPNGLVDFSQRSVYVHRVGWQDIPGGRWTNLWREDAWSFDHANTVWTTDPGMPKAYSESELSPLKLQLYPPPINSGVAEAITVDSVTLDISDPAATLGIPDEWSHAVKWAALDEILSSEGQIKDPLRAQYATQRYKQALQFAKDARSVIRILVNGNPIPIDSLAAIDAGLPFWRNKSGRPRTAGVLYDIVVPAPAIPDTIYGISADVVRSAPLPGPNDFLQIGQEVFDPLISYVTHILTFKCGGKELTDSMDGLDEFMAAIASRKGVDAAKIKYLSPLFGKPQEEMEQRPEEVKTKA